MIVREALDHTNTLSVEEHARIAYCARGPSTDDLKQQIIEHRIARGIFVW